MTDIAYNIFQQASDLHRSAQYGHPRIRVLGFRAHPKTIEAFRRRLNQTDIRFATNAFFAGYMEDHSVREELMRHHTLLGAPLAEDYNCLVGEVQAMIGFAPEPGTGNDPD